MVDADPWAKVEELQRAILAKDAEIAALRADVEEQIRLRDHFGSRLVSLEDEKNAYIDHVGDALGQSDDESLWDAAQRVLSDRDRCRVIVDRLLDAANHNPFGSVGHFCEHGEAAAQIAALKEQGDE